MGIGGGIFLIAVGAIFAFAVRTNTDVIDLDVVGWVLMSAGLAVIVLTIWFWQDRRRRGVATVVEDTRLAHRHGAPIPPDPPDYDIHTPPAP